MVIEKVTYQLRILVQMRKLGTGWRNYDSQRLPSCNRQSPAILFNIHTALL